MGVDARILIKITNPDSWVNAIQLRQISSRLTNVIGHEHFFLQPEENRHAISFVAEENRKWAEKYPNDYPNYDPNGPTIFSQDGDDIVSKPNEQFLEVHVWSRYYGEDYARGDWKTLSWIMMWCVYNIPNCEIWYGGDSSGICAEHMTSKRMNGMTKFYLTSGNDTYWINSKIAYQCEFCQCNVVNSGGGGDNQFYHCDSCGSQWLLKENTWVTKYDPHGEDRETKDPVAHFFMSEQVRLGKRKLYPFDGIFRQVYPYVQKNSVVQITAGQALLESGMSS